LGAEKTGFAESLAARLRQVRAALDLSQGEISHAIGGYRTDTWSRLERCDAIGISVDMLLDLAAWTHKHGISQDWLLAGQGPMWIKDREARVPAAPAPISTQPPQVTRRGRAPRGRPFVVRRVIEPGYETCQSEALPDDWRGDWVPILGKIAAGAGIDTVSAESHPAGLADKFVKCPWACEKPFAVEVVGDSMEKVYFDRDIVVCDGDQQVSSGVCCTIFHEGGERLVRLKRLTFARGKVRLESLNPKHKPLILPAEKFIAAYKIAEHLPFLKEPNEGG